VSESYSEMTNQPCHVLFLCTGNSARSIMAEAILNQLGGKVFRAFSAGSRPRGQVHPEAIALLQKQGYATAGLRSKDLAEFESSDAPRIDVLITVCDSAAKSCPIFWSGALIKVHWGVPDPAEVENPQARSRAFLYAFRTLEQRIRRLVDLAMSELPSQPLRQALQALARMAVE